MKRAFIIHGYGATPEDHWFSWLAQQLQAAGVATAIPALPDPEQPDFDRWQAALATHLGTPDAHTFYVAHSLGTISLLHFLSAEYSSSPDLTDACPACPSSAISTSTPTPTALASTMRRCAR